MNVLLGTLERQILYPVARQEARNGALKHSDQDTRAFNDFDRDVNCAALPLPLAYHPDHRL
jgi:hypothetical protein